MFPANLMIYWGLVRSAFWLLCSQGDTLLFLLLLCLSPLWPQIEWLPWEEWGSPLPASHSKAELWGPWSCRSEPVKNPFTIKPRNVHCGTSLDGRGWAHFHKYGYLQGIILVLRKKKKKILQLKCNWLCFNKTGHERTMAQDLVGLPLWKVALLI